MKIALYITIILGFAMNPIFAAEEVKDEKPTNNVAVEKETPKDLLMGFLVKKAEQYSGKAEEAMAKAVEFAEKEVPETVKQFIIWRAWYHAMKVINPLIMFAIVSVVFMRTWGKAIYDLGNSYELVGDDWNKYTTINLLSFFACVATVITFLVSSIGHIYQFVQVIVAPNVYILEEVSKWMK